METLITYAYAIAHDALMLAFVGAFVVFFLWASLVYCKVWWRWRQHCWKAGRLW